jgi:tRNA threonylcarbamoyladenosine biosynthesis protein TsaE
MQINWLCRSEDELPQIASEVLNKSNGRKFAFKGDLGSGKTTLIRQICKVLQVRENVTSPTFTILNEYNGEGFKVYHFDFYRINKIEEIYDLGYEEYLYSNEYVFIEWPEKLDYLLPDDFLKLNIKTKDNREREIQLFY